MKKMAFPLFWGEGAVVPLLGCPFVVWVFFSAVCLVGGVRERSLLPWGIMDNKLSRRPHLPLFSRGPSRVPLFVGGERGNKLFLLPLPTSLSSFWMIDRAGFTNKKNNRKILPDVNCIQSLTEG